MEKQTVDDASGQRGQTDPAKGQPAAGQTNAEIGAITKGSDGAGHTTQANQSTSTGSPQTPVSDDFLEKLGEMHDAEKQLTRALFLMEAAAESEDLKTLLGVHLKETEGHVRSLEELAAGVGKELPDKKCQPVRDMITEAEKELAKSLVNSKDRDTIILNAGRQAEQFEITAYTPLCATARAHDWTHENAILTSILNQEKLANELLAGVAEGKESLHELIKRVSLEHAAAP